MKKIRIAFVATSLVLLSLSGCSPTSDISTEFGTKIENSEYMNGLTYTAIGTMGDGADDALITIEPTDGDTEGVTDANTILPWTRTVQAGIVGGKVSMRVESLSSDGTVTCQIMYQNVIINNSASGDHAVAVCEGTLDLE